MSAKTKTKIGFWNMRTMYETGKMAQLMAELRHYNLQLLGISESRWSGTEPAPEKQCCIVVKTTTNTMKESPSS